MFLLGANTLGSAVPLLEHTLTARPIVLTPTELAARRDWVSDIPMAETAAAQLVARQQTTAVAVVKRAEGM